jgi:cytosine deaminase
MWTCATTALLAVRALLDVKRRVAPYLDLQLVAFPQDGVLRAPNALANLKRALDLGVDVVGGIPHFERTMADGAESVRLLCELAAERGLRVDMHCDESDDPLSRHIETLAFHTQRLGCRAASPARTSRPCTRWTTTTSASCCR